MIYTSPLFCSKGKCNRRLERSYYTMVFAQMALQEFAAEYFLLSVASTLDGRDEKLQLINLTAAIPRKGTCFDLCCPHT